MTFQYKRRTYIMSNGVVLTEKGKVASESIHRVGENLLNQMKSRKDILRMKYQDFDVYITILSTEEKEKLFHEIYEHYLYAGEMLNGNRQEYFKSMAKMKRYEQYLYKILGS